MGREVETFHNSVVLKIFSDSVQSILTQSYEEEIKGVGKISPPHHWNNTMISLPDFKAHESLIRKHQSANKRGIS